MMNMRRFVFAAVSAFLLAAAPLTAYADNDAATETSVSEEATEAATEKPSKKTTEDGFYNYGFDENGNVELYDFNMQGYLGEVVIPSEIEGKPVVYLGNACFLEAFNITSVVIPATVTDMGESVFFGCKSLEKISVEEGNSYFSVTEDGVLLGDDGKFFICYPPGKKDEFYTIPDGVDELAPGCFAYTQHLRGVDIPDTVGYIDNLAFSHSGIERISIPDSVVQIDDYSFAYCENLAEVDLGNGVESIYHAAFAFCPKLTEIEFPPSVTLIGQYAFCGTGMESVTIPATVTDINFCAFGYDEDLSPIGDFVIYGEPYSMAQTYCTANDSENDYQNNFTFVSLANPEATIASDPDSNSDSSDAEETPGEAASDNKLIVGLAVCGGIVLVLAAVLIVLLVKKPKTKKQGEKK